MKIKFMCLVCLIAFQTQAEITDIPCADGNGVLVNGTLSGQYCMSNHNIGSWWNAWSWCDALNMQLVSMDDCGCDMGVCKQGNHCPNFYLSDFPTSAGWIWMQNASSQSSSRSVKITVGYEYDQYRSGNRYGEDTRALCK